MKRIILILLISIYTTATFGFSVKQFYCCNKLKSTSIAFTQTADQKCGMDKKMDKCCKTTYKYFKVKDNHISNGSSAEPVKLFSDFEFPIPVYKAVALAGTHTPIADYSNPPPLHHGIPVYILNCVFRI